MIAKKSSKRGQIYQTMHVWHPVWVMQQGVVTAGVVSALMATAAVVTADVA